MKRSLLALLRCPECSSELNLTAAHDAPEEVESGSLDCRRCGRSFQISSCVPRFVRDLAQADTFGLQWNTFRRTQLDSHTGIPISRDRFLSFTGWRKEDLQGKLVLDIGCGAGRFAEVALDCGARLVAVDYSGAVDACHANLAARPGFHVVQGDIYKLPFSPAQFDFVYCLGVLQHTPDVRRAFMCLPPQVIPGGRLAVDVYPKLWRNLLWSKYWIRPITRRMDRERLFNRVKSMVSILWPVSLAVGRVPILGRRLRYLIPVANYEGVLPLNSDQLKEWALLDTYDMLSPTHDHPQKASDLRKWFVEAGFRDIEVFRKGFHVGRGSKPG